MQAIALYKGSKALGAGESTTCTSAPISNADQRGNPRPNFCSVGAFDTGTPKELPGGSTTGSTTGGTTGTTGGGGGGSMSLWSVLALGLLGLGQMLRRKAKG